MSNLLFLAIFLSIIEAGLVLAFQCAKFCNQCEPYQKLCLECQFKMLPFKKTCHSRCDSSMFLINGQCLSTCPVNYYYDKLRGLCTEVQECPLFNMKGSNYHKGKIIQVLKDQKNSLIMTSGENERLLKFWDLKDCSFMFDIEMFHSDVVKISEDFDLDKFYTLEANGHFKQWQLSQISLKSDFQLKKGIVNKNSQIYVQKKLVSSFGLLGDFYLTKFVDDAYTVLEFWGGHQKAVIGLIFDQIQQILISYDQAGTVIIRQLNDLPGIFKIQFQSINEVQFIELFDLNQAVGIKSKDTNYLDVVFVENEAAITINRHSSQIFQTFFIRSKKIVCSLDVTNQLVVTIRINGKYEERLNIPTSIKKLYFDENNNDRFLASLIDDSLVIYSMFSDSQTGLVLLEQVTDNFEDQASQLAIITEERLILLGTDMKVFVKSGNSWVTQFKHYLVPQPLVAHSQNVNGLIYDDYNNFIITYADDGYILFYDLIVKVLIRKINLNEITQSTENDLKVKRVFLLDKYFLAVHFGLNQVCVMDIFDVRPLQIFANNQEIVNFIALESKGLVVAISISHIQVIDYKQLELFSQLIDTTLKPFDLSTMLGSFLLTVQKNTGEISQYNIDSKGSIEMVKNRVFGKTTNIVKTHETIFTQFMVCFQDGTCKLVTQELADLYTITSTANSPIRLVQVVAWVNPPGITYMLDNNNVFYAVLLPYGIIVSSFKPMEEPIINLYFLSKVVKFIGLVSNGGSRGSRLYVQDGKDTMVGYGIYDTQTDANELIVNEEMEEAATIQKSGIVQMFALPKNIRYILPRTDNTTIKRVINYQEQNWIIILSNTRVEILDLISQTQVNSHTAHTPYPVIGGQIIKNIVGIVTWTGSTEQNLFVWEPNTDTLTQLVGHTMAVNQVIIDESTQQFISYSEDSTIIVWDAKTLNQIGKISDLDGGVTTLILQNNVLVGFSKESNQVMFWSLTDLKNERKIQLTEKIVNIKYEPLFKNIYVFGDFLRVFSLEQGLFITEIDVLNKPLQIINIFFTEEYIISFNSGKFMSYLLKTFEKLYEWETKYPILDAQIFRNMFVIAHCQFYGPFFMWDFRLNIIMSELKYDAYVQNPNTHPYFNKFFIDDDFGEVVITNDILMPNVNQVIILIFNPLETQQFRRRSVIANEYANSVDINVQPIGNMLLHVTQYAVYLWQYYAGIGSALQSLPYQDQYCAIYNNAGQSLYSLDRTSNLMLFKDNQVLFLSKSQEQINGHFIFTPDEVLMVIVLQNSVQITPFQNPSLETATQVIDIRVEKLLQTGNSDFSVGIGFKAVWLANWKMQINIFEQLFEKSDRIIDALVIKDFNHVIVYCSNGELVIFNYQSQVNFREFQDHTKGISNVIYSLKLNLLISFGKDNKINIYSYTITDATLQSSINTSDPKGILKGVIIEQSQLLITLGQMNSYLSAFDLTNFQLLQFLVAPDENNLKLENYQQFDQILVYSKIQLNIYSLSSLFPLHSRVRKSNFNDIGDVQMLSQNFILMTCNSKLVLFRFEEIGGTWDQDYLYSVNQPKIIKFQILQTVPDESQLSVNVIGASLDGFFNHTFVANIKPYFECFHEFLYSGNNFQLKQEIILVEGSLQHLSKNVDNTVYAILIQSGSPFVFFDDFQYSNQEVQLSYRPEKTDSSSLKIISKTQIFKMEIQGFYLETMELSNLNLDFSTIANESIKINPKVMNFQLKNIIIISDLSNSSINFEGLDLVDFQNITFSNFTANCSSQSFFYLKKIKKVVINGLYLSNLIISQMPLFYMENVDELNIEGVSMNNLLLTDCSSIIDLKGVKNIVSSDVRVKGITVNNNNSKNPSEIWHVENSKIVNFSQVIFENNCDLSFGYFSDFSKFTEQEIQFINSEINFENSTFWNNSVKNQSLLVMDFKYASIKAIRFMNNSCPQCLGSCLNIKMAEISLVSNSFENIYGYEGGAIYIEESPIDRNNQLLLNNFTNCSSKTSGGAIRFKNVALSNFSKNIFNKNSALIGGAIRYTGCDLWQQILATPLINKTLENNVNSSKRILVEDDSINYFENNKAAIFGSNIASHPRRIQLNSSKESNLSFVDDIYEASNHSSGSAFYLEIQLLDEQNNTVVFQPDLTYPEQILRELESLFSIEINTQGFENIRVEGENFQIYKKFSFADQKFKFENLFITSLPHESSFINIITPSVILLSKTIPHSFDYMEKYQSTLKINFRECVVGEIYLKQSELILCHQCEVNYYSLMLPNFKNNFITQCKQCPDSAEECQNKTIILQNGFWRENLLTDNIVECTESSNLCKDDKKGSGYYCEIGHIGPLCEQCDTLGEKWGETYGSIGNYNCVICSNPGSTITLYVFSSIIILLYMIYSVYFTIYAAKRRILVSYLRLMNCISMSQSQSEDMGNLLIKSLVHYFQIVTVLRLVSVQYGVNIPVEVQLMPSILGEPIQSLENSFDCAFLGSDEFPSMYIRVVWSLVIPISYSIFLGFLYLVLVRFKIMMHKVSYIWNGTIFVILLMQPGIVKMLVRVLSCREIAGESYVSSDLRFHCRTSQHNKYVISLVMPSFIIWMLGMPGLLFRILWKNRQQLNSINTRISYGFLYNDYKHKSYYWEFTQILLQVLLILVFSILEDQKIQFLLIIMLLVLYLFSSYKIMPVINKWINMIDWTSHFLLIILVMFKLYTEFTPKESQRVALSVLIVILNYSYLVYLIIHLLQSKFQKFIKYSQQFRTFLYEINPSRFGFLKVNDQLNHFRVFNNWRKCYVKFSQSLYYAHIYQKILFSEIKEFRVSTNQYQQLHQNSLKKEYSFQKAQYILLKKYDINQHEEILQEKTKIDENISIFKPRYLKQKWDQQLTVYLAKQHGECLIEDSVIAQENLEHDQQVPLDMKISILDPQDMIVQQSTNNNYNNNNNYLGGLSSSNNKFNSFEPFSASSEKKIRSSMQLKDLDLDDIKDSKINSPANSDRDLLQKLNINLSNYRGQIIERESDEENVVDNT